MEPDEERPLFALGLARLEPVHRHVHRQLAGEVLGGAGDVLEALAEARIVVAEVAAEMIARVS